MVSKVGVEPTRPRPQPPQGCVATNSTTPTEIYLLGMSLVSLLSAGIDTGANSGTSDTEGD